MTPDPRVDAYLAAQPHPHRDLLQALREQVAALLPEASETISYGMPTFKVSGKLLLSYASWKQHCSLYPLTGTFLDEHADIIAGFDTTKGSVHFTPERPLPADVIEKLVQLRLADIEAGRR